MSSPSRVIPIQPADDATRRPASMFEAQRKVYARSVKGLFASWRWVMVWITQLIFYGLPWLSWNGRQAVLFDLDARRFYLPGLVLYPQDFIYLSALLVLSAFALFFFTAIAGRMWCGFACPQTVYTEIFMWIERRIEGDRIARMKLDQAPWSARKLVRKGAKQAAWIALSLWTGFTFVGYFTPIRELGASALALGLGPWESFWVFFYGLATYGNAGFLREQVCKTMCPYARFQGSMMDKDSLIIGYDSRRGESRGSRARSADPKALGLGDCIDCTLCVQVCPTGIDIRNGLQMECIGCAACIDACDKVMDKMGYARGLIRYATVNGLEQGLGKAQMWRRVARPRVLVYGALLLAVGVAFTASLALRDPLRVNVVRDRGVMARMVDDGAVENVYRVLVMNATEAPQRYRIAASGLPGLAVAGDTELELAPAAERSIPVSVRLPAEAAAALSERTQHIRFEVTQVAGQGRAASVQEASTFLLPR
ncbi:cytochrome c oxidase accessory protein CcoG [uncultured Azohydromonas sp.]|jgi:cytochrome c oxidase accessory protein FixG|uniref:cytochrome c oxidase accessory protein CcoG n=1 Tax=uncultured Azohydromonas sp. TaxID=487342 RepID=UPI0026031684|nr:cytochrome c oxidase accessory protein CcoG [uncultured Azohydromonas sp.]